MTAARERPPRSGEARDRAQGAPRFVERRDGTLVPFDPARISSAVARAEREAGRHPGELGGVIVEAVVAELARRFPDGAAPVEEIQDAVERALVARGAVEVARAYAVYRQRRAELRRAKAALGVRDELKLSLNAAIVLKERYLRRDEEGRIRESTAEMMERVARHVADAEDEVEPGSGERWAEEFSSLLKGLLFLPNSPTLMNAGTQLGLLSGCFVLPLEDSLESVFETLKRAALIQKEGGGTGFSFSRLRPAGDRVASTGGTASGPVTFLHVFDAATDAVRQGGRRRGANMAVLDVSHPDVRAFVAAKLEPDALENFNLSVAVGDGFLRAVERGGSHELVNPRTGRGERTVEARRLFDEIVEAAWRAGEPGLLFLDRVNAANPVPTLGRIEATNPCGEVPLLPYESCNLGSINLARLVRDGALDWEELARVVRLAVRFLDDVITVNRYPFPELEEAALATRKIGLGVMGLAELLAALGLPYDSEPALELAERIAAWIRQEARAASAELAAERGPFPRFPDSVFARAGGPPLRNAQLTSIAPTGTISVIAGTTAGIEPMFALAYFRNVLGTRLVELNPLFERTARERGFWSDDLAAEILERGTLRDLPGIPEDVRRAFVTALELPPQAHVRMQAVFQRHTDAAVSKTVNLPEDASPDAVREVFLSAWRAGVKGITVYRYGSRPSQVLTVVAGPSGATAPVADPVYAGGCAGRLCEV
ncbi:MAG: adenosylcobalamin-dependent ribonucleoside-diphosphate reductase [Thermoleophilia bacterium]|nr:adenosylcobalamin-dependent ribonucleoside-diphosphate reductase [Gaiellaceae bacterium]MDW8338911.1 adenosylcobalamin-dependent ribonucleoside-diphosphate reductase [Thermoleophilia bacterium]